MSGHSKWSTIKHKKAANDKKRGKIFTKLIRELTVASKLGGGDPEGNPRLKTAILKAKEANMAKDTMERAIKKGIGEVGGSNYEEFYYEGYGPDGVAILMEIMTDNKNRASSDVKTVITKSGGNLGTSGCVSYMFDKRGIIIFDINKISEEKAMEIGIDAGALDISNDGKNIEVITSVENFYKVLNAFNQANIEHVSAEITMIPNTYQDIAVDKIERVLNLIDRLEDLDDVQNIFTNLNIPENYTV